MPHIIVEYAESLSGETDMTGLVQDLHATLAREESVDLKRIKSRAIPVKIYNVGDRGAEGAFAHITLKLLPRPDDVAKRMATDLQTAAHAKLPKNCAVTVEVVDLKPATYCA